MCIPKEATLTLTRQSNVRLADSTPIILFWSKKSDLLFFLCIAVKKLLLVTNLWFWAPDCNFQNCWVFSTDELFCLSQLWPGSCAISHLKMPCPLYSLSRSVTIHLPLISLLHCSRFYIPHAHTHTGKFHSPNGSLEPATHLMIFIHQLQWT